MKRAAALACVVASAILTPLPALAAGGGQLLAGAAFAIGSPSGDFGDAAGTGYAFAASGLYLWGHDSPIGFRVSGTGAWYGSNTMAVSGPGAGGLSVESKPRTFVLVGGPQLVKRDGPARPYANILAGFAHISTLATLSGSGGTLSDSEFQKDAFAWSVGAGVLFPVSHRFNIDVGGRYTDMGELDFVGAAGFSRSSGGQVAPSLERAKVHVFEGLVGVTFAF
jgi:opacity protein-like surface antigen